MTTPLTSCTIIRAATSVESTGMTFRPYSNTRRVCTSVKKGWDDGVHSTITTPVTGDYKIERRHKMYKIHTHSIGKHLIRTYTLIQVHTHVHMHKHTHTHTHTHTYTHTHTHTHTHTFDSLSNAFLKLTLSLAVTTKSSFRNMTPMSLEM